MSPRSRQQNEEIRAERRQQILEVAIPLFARQGFDATPVSAVARAAGLSHGTVFLYFPTKEELFRAALLEPLAEAEQQARETLNGPGSPLARLKQLIITQLRTFAAKDAYLRLAHHVLGQRERFADLVPQLFAFTDRFARLLSPVIEEGQRLGELAPGDPRAIAFAWFAYLNGVSLVTDPPGSPHFDETLSAFAQTGLRLFGPK